MNATLRPSGVCARVPECGATRSAAARLDPTQIRVADLSDTRVDRQLEGATHVRRVRAALERVRARVVDQKPNLSPREPYVSASSGSRPENVLNVGATLPPDTRPIS